MSGTEAGAGAGGVDLAAIEATWLQQCGSCDAGLTMDCTCPSGDVRSVVAALVDRVRAAEAERDVWAGRCGREHDGWERERIALADAHRALDKLREFIGHPGNWDALDGRRAHMLRVLAASRGAAGDTEQHATTEETPDV